MNLLIVAVVIVAVLAVFPPLWGFVRRRYQASTPVIRRGLIAIVIAFILAIILFVVGMSTKNSLVVGLSFLISIGLLVIILLVPGLILRLFGIRINSLKIAIAWLAFLGFLGMLYPGIISLRLLVGLSLLGLLSFGFTEKINVFDKIIYPLVIFMSLIVVWKFSAPDNFRATSRHLSAKVMQLDVWHDRSSIIDEAEASATYGYLLKNTQVAYKVTLKNDTISAISIILVSLKRNFMFLILNPKHKIYAFGGQAFLQIKLPKANGSFVGGRKIWIEADLIRQAGSRISMYSQQSRRQTLVSSKKAAIKVKYYYPGDNPQFNLKANEETGWLNIPINNLNSAQFAANGSFFFIQKGVAPIFVKMGGNTHLPNGDFKLRANKKPVFISIKIL